MARWWHAAIAFTTTRCRRKTICGAPSQQRRAALVRGYVVLPIRMHLHKVAARMIEAGIPSAAWDMRRELRV